MYNIKQKLMCLLTAVLLSMLLCMPAMATSTDYDSAHPENLNMADLQATAAILIEKNTGMVVFEKNADRRMFPASTTKIMTVYLGLLLGDLNEKVTTTASSLMIPSDSSTIPLVEGEEIYFKDLLYATMVRSGNEGANLIAETISGSNEAFANLMNQYAVSIGCTDTHFTNPHGLHDENHYTTARDMALIAREAMQNKNFEDIANTTVYTLPKSNIYRARSLTCRTHDFFGDPESATYYEYANGIKTGNTNAAGHCFVGSAEKDGVEFISVVFYTPSYKACWSDTKKLMEYGFTQVESISPESLYAEDPRVIDVTGFALDDAGHGELTLGIRAADDSKNMTIVGNSEKIDLLRENFAEVSAIRWTREFRAPINVGDVMGILTFYSETGETAEYELVATRSIAMRENAPPTLEQIEAYTAADDNPWPRFSWDLLVPPGLLLLAILWLHRFIRRHRKRRPKAPDIKPIKKRYVR